jgi:hypothetical protein
VDVQVQQLVPFMDCEMTCPYGNCLVKGSFSIATTAHLSCPECSVHKKAIIVVLKYCKAGLPLLLESELLY